MKEELIRMLRREIAARLDAAASAADEDVYACIDETLQHLPERRRLSLEERLELRRRLFHSFRGLGLLQELLDDDSISEIMVNGSETIFLECGSEMVKSECRFPTEQELEDVIQVMAARMNRMVNTASPIVDLRLADGSRVNIVLPPASLDGPAMTIRKFSKRHIGMEDMLRQGAISAPAAAFLQGAVAAGYNIFVSGGTNSGKTTFLNALSRYIPACERVITIEDVAELSLGHLPNLVRLETRDANLEGENAISIRTLIRTALRMRPNRIVVGEVRGAEALDMLQAMNTGHQGSLSTGHANSARDMLSRLETMVLTGGELPLQAIRAQIASAVDLLVHMGRLTDRQRRVLSITEIRGMSGAEIDCRELYVYKRGEGLAFQGGELHRSFKWEEYFGEKPALS